MKLLIDAGHGGNDPGTSNGNYKEKNYTLSATLKIASYLIILDPEIEIAFTRISDRTLSLKNRVDMIKMYKPDMFISIHFNAPSSGTGFESFIRRKPTNYELTIQAAIHDKIAIPLSIMGLKDRGMKLANFYVLRNSPYPAILIEICFIANLEDIRKYSADAMSYYLTKALAEGVHNALIKIC